MAKRAAGDHGAAPSLTSSSAELHSIQTCIDAGLWSDDSDSEMPEPKPGLTFFEFLKAWRTAGGHGAASSCSSALLNGLLYKPEGRAVWEALVAPLAGRLGLAALAAACTAGRDYRRGRVAGGEEKLLRLTIREACQSPRELRAAASLGGLELNSSRTLCWTAKYGTAEALAWLFDNTEAREKCHKHDKPSVWRRAAKAVDSDRVVAKLEVLLKHIPGEWDVWACNEAAYRGYMDALVWLHEHGALWNEWTCRGAAEGGHLEALRYAREHGCQWQRERCLEEARENGHERVVAWIEQQPP